MRTLAAVTTPGVLINANARAVRRDAGLVARLTALASHERTRVTSQLDEIDAALAELLDAGVDALLVVGGDGTLPHTLTRLLRSGDAAALPAIVPTRGGHREHRGGLARCARHARSHARAAPAR
jgi:hypothetical protein